VEGMGTFTVHDAAAAWREAALKNGGTRRQEPDGVEGWDGTVIHAAIQTYGEAV